MCTCIYCVSFVYILFLSENKLFRTDCKKFYNRLRQPNPKVKNAPGKEEVENF